MWYNGSSAFGKFQIIIWNIPNSEIQETQKVWILKKEKESLRRSEV